MSEKAQANGPPDQTGSDKPSDGVVWQGASTYCPRKAKILSQYVTGSAILDSPWPAFSTTKHSLGQTAASYRGYSILKGTKVSFLPWMNSIGMRHFATCFKALACHRL